MTRQISPQIRIVALAGLLLALAGGAASLLLARQSSSGSEAVPVAPHTNAHAPVAAPTPAPAPAPAPAKPAVPEKHAAAPAKPAAKPAAQPATKPAARGVLVDARLPKPLQLALAQHRIVVVSVHNPRSQTDAISVAEAHAGAVDAHVGFLLVSLLDDPVAGRLTALLPGGGLLPNPGILVYRRPGTLVYRFDGFSDRASVAQAATNAKHGEVAQDVTDPAVETATAASTATTGTAAP